MAGKKKISCVVPGCGFTDEAATEEELLKGLAKHGHDDHGLEEIPPEVLEKARATVKEV